MKWQVVTKRSFAANPMTLGNFHEWEAERQNESSLRFSNPNGIASSSPGLRGTSYPRWPKGELPTPTGLRPAAITTRPQPRWGCWLLNGFPRVARSSQPWALGRNPVGIQRGEFRTRIAADTCSAGFQACCVAGFQTCVRRNISAPSRGRTPRRLGSRRHSRFGNLRYRRGASRIAGRV